MAGKGGCFVFNNHNDLRHGWYRFSRRDRRTKQASSSSFGRDIETSGERWVKVYMCKGQQ